VEKRIFIGMSLLLLLSTLVFSLIDQQVYDSILALEQVETYRNEAMGGGIVGMVLSGIMVRLFSETGTWIFVVFLILLVLLMTIPATIQDYYQKMRQKTGQLKAEREEQRQKRKERIEAEKALKQLESSESTTKTEKSDKPLKILDYKDIRPENETIAEEEKEPESASNPSEETSIKEIPETKEEEKKEEEALSFHK
ncbi:MAG TPA: hypothetical protein DHN33_00215, partial [Eubacteriaceae bacterium]|nr:hypothetical protein [Eubacteriaceae bacterium]